MSAKLYRVLVFEVVYANQIHMQLNFENIGHMYHVARSGNNDIAFTRDSCFEWISFFVLIRIAGYFPQSGNQ